LLIFFHNCLILFVRKLTPFSLFALAYTLILLPVRKIKPNGATTNAKDHDHVPHQQKRPEKEGQWKEEYAVPEKTLSFHPGAL
ncbi:MAG: hypothetical protein AB1553_05560, partial [Nitrospirota bacterium]